MLVGAARARDLRSNWPILGRERREILRAGIDAVLVRRATGFGLADSISDRVLVLFRGEAPAPLTERDGPCDLMGVGKQLRIT